MNQPSSEIKNSCYGLPKSFWCIALGKLLVAAASVAFAVSCTGDSEFNSGGASSSRAKNADGAAGGKGRDSENLGGENGDGSDNLGEDGLPRDILGGDGLSGELSLASSGADSSVWVVNSQGRVFRIKLDKDAGYPTTEWDGAGGGGHRTFVTKIGLIIGTTNQGIFRASDDRPGTVEQILALDSPNRVCVTSYSVNGTEYIGAGYERSFVQIPIDMSKPMRVDVSKAKYFTRSVSRIPGNNDDDQSGPWGYSCFLDRARNHFWSQFAGQPTGLNLNTGEFMSVSESPNGGSHISMEGIQIRGQSYAMGGDSKGNIINFPRAYTSVHDPMSDTVFISQAGGSKLTLTRGECIRSSSTCTAADFFDFDMSQITNVAPMSPLNDGRVVGLSRRGRNGDVSILSLVNPSDISAGVDVEVIKTLDGDPYMYSDFTGSQLYANTVTKTLDLSSLQGYKPGLKIRDTFVKWKSTSGDGQPWQGLKASARCYNSVTGATSPMTKVDTIDVSGKYVNMAVPSCSNGTFDKLDFKIEPVAGAEIYSLTESFSFVFQL